MPQRMNALPASGGSPRPPMDPADLEPTLRQVLSDLADLDLQYDEQRAALDHWPGPEVMKQQLAHELQERHRRDRADGVELREGGVLRVGAEGVPHARHPARQVGMARADMGEPYVHWLTELQHS